MKCKLCGSTETKLAKSHITPLGFFSGVSTKAVLQSVGTSGGRKLQSALYDREILCPACERDVIGPLDDYGIKIFRDKYNSEKISIKNGKAAIYIFENIDTRMIRAFIASLLWRISVSKQKEIARVSIGHTNVKKVGVDLRRKDAKFEYIDAVTSFLTDEFHQGFIVPYRRKLLPKDPRRDKTPVKAMVVGLPNMVIVASIDNKRHPYRGYYSLNTDLTGRKDSLLVSTSLLEKKSGHAFIIIEQEKSDVIEESMFNIMESSPNFRKAT